MSEFKSLEPIRDTKPGVDAYNGKPTVDYIAFDETGVAQLKDLYPALPFCIRDTSNPPDYFSSISDEELNAKPYPRVLCVIGGADAADRHIVLEAAGITEIEALSALLKQNEEQAKEGNYLMTTNNENVNYFALIRDWGKARNIIGGGSTPIDQFTKGLTEAGELWSNILGGKIDKLKDDIGDTLVCLTQSYGIMGIDIEKALGGADARMREERELYKLQGEWALKRAGFRVLRNLSSISWNIEDIQFDNDIENLAEDDLLGETRDMIVTLSVVAEAQGWTLQDCLEEAYNDIKDRKGVMYNGGFVKEAGLTVDYAKEMLASGKVGGVGADYLNSYIENHQA